MIKVNEKLDKVHVDLFRPQYIAPIGSKIYVAFFSQCKDSKNLSYLRLI